jgi:hypothetical protein
MRTNEISTNAIEPLNMIKGAHSNMLHSGVGSLFVGTSIERGILDPWLNFLSFFSAGKNNHWSKDISLC